MKPLTLKLLTTCEKIEAEFMPDIFFKICINQVLKHISKMSMAIFNVHWALYPKRFCRFSYYVLMNAI